MRRLRRSLSAVLTLAVSGTALWAFTPPADAATGAVIRITEYAYGGKAAGTGGTDGEYVELTNVGDTAQDLTGWKYDNSAATFSTALSLSSLGTVAPGESVIITDLTAAEFRTEWGLKSTVKVLSNGKTHTLNGGPNAVHVYDNTGTDVDTVSYASGYFTGGKGQAAAGSTATSFSFETVGDGEGSWTSASGAVGSPGASTLGTKTPTDVRAAADVEITEYAYGGKASGAGGTDGEYVELTNLGQVAQDLTGWKYDNSAATFSTALSLSTLGSIAPGESVIVTDLTAAEFRTEWGLKDTVKVLSNGKTHTLNGGPNAVHVYDSTGTDVSTVSYASGYFTGGKGQAAKGSPGTGWTFATAGDGEGSWTSANGAVGSPGASSLGTTTPADVRTSTDGGGGDTPTVDPHYADIVINEITSNNSGNGFAPLDADDLIELYNTGSNTVSLSGWKQTDSNAGGFASASDFSTGLYVDGALATSIPAGGYGVFSSGPGLSSGGDAVKIYTPDGTLVDQITYTAGQAGVDETVNTAGTYTALASCPNGGNTVLEVRTASFGADNTSACVNGITPLTSGNGPEAPCQSEDSGNAAGTVPADVATWPGSQTPTTIDDQCAWVTSFSGQDLSGLAFDPNDADVLYAVKNKSHVWRLVRSGSTWVKDTTNDWGAGKDLRFPAPNTSGLPDSEGLTVGPDGALYITTERDNADSGVPLDSILRFDPTASGTTLTATDQWVLTSDLGFTNADANLGFEGVAYVPDSFLTGAGFRTDAGTLYDPADYPDKAVPGLLLGAVEKTGHLRAYVLNTDHTWTRVADISTGLVGVMDASYDPDLGRIWAHCDNTCGNATSLLKVGSDGHFAVDHSYRTPTNLPNYNLEGFAVAPYSTGDDGSRQVLWADDGNRFGHSLWGGTLDLDLGLDQVRTPTPTILGTPAVGQTLTAGTGTWDAGVTKHYSWTYGDTVLGTDAPLVVGSDQAGHHITLEVTGTKPGFTGTTRTASVDIAVPAAPVLTGPSPTIDGTPAIGQVLAANVGTWESGVTTHYTWTDGATVLGTDGPLALSDAALVGRTITLTVTAAKAGYTGATRTATTTITKGTLTGPAPTIDGDASLGGTVTASTGSWGSGVTTHYTWTDGASVLSTDGPLTLSDAALVGRTITLTVTATKAGYTDATRTASVTVGEGTLDAPRPTISGNPKVGKTLTAVATWGPGTVQLTYAWFADGQRIGGADGQSLDLGPGQAGKEVTVEVTGTKAGYTTETKTSDATAPVAKGVISSSKPTVSGVAKVGRSLSADAGDWSAGGGKVELAYQWFADGKAIKGATSDRLDLTNKLKGDKITVTVTGSAKGFKTVDETSKPTGKIK